MFRFIGLYLGMLIRLFRVRRSLLLENLALRQQLVVLKRRRQRPGLSPVVRQTDRAILEGTITDQSGATVAGASIKLTDVNTGISQESTSNGHGYYLVPGLAVTLIPFPFQRPDLTRR